MKSKIKNLGIIFIIVTLMLSIMILPGCDASGKYIDLTRNSNSANIISNMINNPSSYVNREFKVAGKYRSASSTYQYIEIVACCGERIELRKGSGGIRFPSPNANITVVATYRVSGGQKYLEVGKIL